MLTNATLRQDAERNLRSINDQISQTTYELNEAGISPGAAKYQDGSHILAPMLLAKANTLLALAMLGDKK